MIVQPLISQNSAIILNVVVLCNQAHEAVLFCAHLFMIVEMQRMAGLNGEKHKVNNIVM